jgi:UDP-glucose 4-epimerase
MSTVLVTGGCGYIGGHVVHALEQKGDQVVIVDDLSYGKKDRAGSHPLVVQDVAAPEAPKVLAQVMRLYHVDSVIHFAARKQVGESVAKPLWYYQQNVNGLLNVLIAMVNAGVRDLVFSSSAATYGIPPVDVVTETTSPMVPINPYGQTKLFGEWMGNAVAKAHGIHFVGLRYFNVAGCGPVELEDPAILNLIPMVFNNLKKGTAPAIFGDDYPTPDGTCVRDYVHVSDLADAHVAALEYLKRPDDQRPYSAFNVGTGKGTSVRQIVDEIKKVTGLPFTEKIEKRRAGDPPQLICSPERINKVMGWHARYDVHDIVESAWKAWQANPAHHFETQGWKQVD